MRITVTGAGGAIGGHLVRALIEQGHNVRAVDIKPNRQWWQLHEGAENWGQMDLRNIENAHAAVINADRVYDLAEEMGGIGFITSNRVECSESLLIGMNVLKACHKAGVGRVFFSSSACVYPIHLQSVMPGDDPDEKVDSGFPHGINLGTVGSLQASTYKHMAEQGLTEDQAWPAMPEDGYGLAKLFMEELCRYYREDKGLDTRVARYHNIFGAPGSWNDGREKAPAAICRKVAQGIWTGKREIDVWGDGKQLRSYLHVDDCVRGTIALMESHYTEPMNIGSVQAVTVNQLIDMVQVVAEGPHSEPFVRAYDTSKPQGVAARNADISIADKELGWAPQLTLEEGLTLLYPWVENEVRVLVGS